MTSYGNVVKRDNVNKRYIIIPSSRARGQLLGQESRKGWESNTDGTKTSYKDDHAIVEKFPVSYGTLIRGLNNIRNTLLCFTARRRKPPAQPPSWRTPLCWFSVAAYQIY